MNNKIPIIKMTKLEFSDVYVEDLNDLTTLTYFVDLSNTTITIEDIWKEEKEFVRENPHADNTVIHAYMIAWLIEHNITPTLLIPEPLCFRI